MRGVIDGHLDLALSAITVGRDIRQPLDEVRRLDPVDSPYGQAMVTLPELRRGGVGIVVATVLARCKPWVDPGRKPLRTDLDYAQPETAYAVAQGQLAYYRLLERQNLIYLILHRSSLETHWNRWMRSPASTPIGVILMMEGADPIVEPKQLSDWYEQGLRCLSLAHFGRSRYAAGTPSRDPASPERDGPLTAAGRTLLLEMERLGVVLDVTHLGDRSFAEALDRFGGRICATHANARALADSPRQLTDDQVRTLSIRGGVIGVALHNAMIRCEPTSPTLAPPREQVSLSHLADHVDHLCQVIGDRDHVAIGSDLDGGFGAEMAPREVDSVADLTRLAEVLGARGYSDSDLDAICYRNWLRFWGEALPARQ